jgi:four helix bundle protein
MPQVVTASSKMMRYERFRAWHAAHQLALQIYRMTDRWPNGERFGLTSQLRRAALSTPTNIAEGAAQRGPREFRRFLDTALGSLSEMSYLLRFSRDYGVLEEQDWRTIEATRSEVGRLTWRLYSVVSQQAKEQSPS